MIVRADTLAAGSRIGADVCIVGAGPAGLTLADRLRGSGARIVLLESGGHDPDPRAKALAEGTLVGEGFRFNGDTLGLADTHLRQFGGTSNHWTGQCRPLDPHDFAARAAVPDSGWPFGIDALGPDYAKAVVSCELATDRWDAAWWATNAHVPVLVDDGAVRTVVFQFSPPTRFGPARRTALEQATDVHVYLGATAVNLVPTPDGSHVDAVTVATFGGTRWTVEADVVVLALGGIETPRLLLASRDASPAGLGNSHDLVGRYFMEHPHAIAGRARFTTSMQDLGFYVITKHGLPDGQVQLTWAGLSPTADAQREAGIGNGVVLVWYGTDGPPRGARDANTGAPAAVSSLLRREGRAPTEAALSVRIEQEPNPSSRVMLGADTDELGLPRPVVDWRLTDGDRHTLRRTVELVAAGLGAAGLARVELDPSGSALERWPVEIGNHHMGTTRLHDDPTHGVVDADLRLHEVDNVYVCGSAVFPTSGMANPTLTIVALAHRLASRLGGARR